MNGSQRPIFGYEADRGEFLYHYTTRTAGLGSILPSGQLRLGLFTATNDPREAKDWWFSLTCPTDAPSSDETMRIFTEATRLAKATSKVLCLTMDDHSRLPPDEVLGRGYAHSRMWAQYAGGHSGMCLILDWKGLDQRLSKFLTGKGDLFHDAVRYGDSRARDVDAFNLDYDNIRQDGLESAVERQVRIHHSTLFFSKGLEWSSEFEYRWVLRNPTPAPEFVPIHGVLRGVVVGEDFPQSDNDALAYQCERLGVQAAGRITWRNGFPTVLPGPWSEQGERAQAD
jgi:hypothetical protein